MASKISWRKSDSISLGKAVSNFNKTINQLEKEESNLVLPDPVSFKELKSDITTRKELNRIISSLKRFQLPNQQEAVKLDSDIEVTRWERTELRKAKKRAERRLEGELVGIESRAIGTGNTRANEIKATLKSFEKLEKASIEDFKRISKSIFRQGKTDYEYKKALTFQQNFITAYEKMGRKEIVEIARKFRNPEKFWDFINSSEFIDLKMHYDREEGLIETKMEKDDAYYSELMDVLENLNI